MRAPDPLDRAGGLRRRHLAIRRPAEAEAHPLATAAAAPPPPVRPLLCIALSIGHRAPGANDGGDVRGQLLDGGDLNVELDLRVFLWPYQLSRFPPRVVHRPQQVAQPGHVRPHLQPQPPTGTTATAGSDY